MNSLKLKQFALGLCIVLSLFASSVAACGCSHHQEKVETDALSCHQQRAETHSEEMPMPPETANVNFSADDICVCSQSAPRVFAKSEIVKIEKQAKADLPKLIVAAGLVATVLTAENYYFSKPFYLSDSSYNIKSPRAPPVS